MVDLPHRQPVLGDARTLDVSWSLWVAETIRAGSGDHPAHELMKVWIDLDLCSRDGCSARRTRRARLRGGAEHPVEALSQTVPTNRSVFARAVRIGRLMMRIPSAARTAPKEETNVLSRSRIRARPASPGLRPPCNVPGLLGYPCGCRKRHPGRRPALS